ncbi:DUF2130 domain-containing protein [Occallatibacter savannae]|uniref:DUF2130 domain-containing protein n=1 Tax=Occallatibacter savannae TaxID=1002691 RepID=UPI000D69E694|nr:DUF2130 domain-containing protein [Occallatibacter savannae]
MVEPVIVCPSCHTEIKLTESLAAPVVAAIKQEYEKKLAEKDTEVSAREAVLQKQEQDVAKARAQVDAAIEQGIRRERQTIAAEEGKRARLLVSDELEAKSRGLADLEQVIAAKDEKLAEAQKAQAELLRKERELDDARRELDLTVEQRVQTSLGSVREKARRDVEAELNLKVTEREETIAGLQRQIEILKQKAEQGSQQLQGEVQELELECLLAQKFPLDQIDPVPKGQFGGDILQHVHSSSGQICGSMLWESKRTRNWSDGWLAKLRNDQRSAKADIAILVSRALPKEVESFDLVDGVWVVDPRCAIPVAIALRRSLIDIANARQANEGRQTKMEVMYSYLTGPRFRMHVQSIVEKFTAMEEDLASERRSMARIWAKRECQIQGAIESTAMLYGDLQGIAGRSLEEIEGLELPLLSEGAAQ